MLTFKCILLIGYIVLCKCCSSDPPPPCTLKERIKAKSAWYTDVERNCDYRLGPRDYVEWRKTFIDATDTSWFYIATGNTSFRGEDFECTCLSFARSKERIRNGKFGDINYSFRAGNFANANGRTEPVRIKLLFPKSQVNQPIIDFPVVTVENFEDDFEDFVMYYGSPRHNVKLPKNPESIKDFTAFWQRQLPVKIIFVGYPTVLTGVPFVSQTTNDLAAEYVAQMADAYLFTRSFNVIYVQLKLASKTWSEIDEMGNRIKKYIVKLLEDGLIICVNDIHLHGFFLTAHFAGYLGNAISQETINNTQDAKLGRITAFAPYGTGPLKESNIKLDWNLTSEDATFVEVIEMVPNFAMTFSNIKNTKPEDMDYELCLSVRHTKNMANFFLYGLFEISPTRNFWSKIHSFELGNYYSENEATATQIHLLNVQGILPFVETIKNQIPIYITECFTSISRSIAFNDNCKQPYGGTFPYGYNVGQRDGVFYYPGFLK